MKKGIGSRLRKRIKKTNRKKLIMIILKIKEKLKQNGIFTK